jgi:hypothetical protein
LVDEDGRPIFVIPLGLSPKSVLRNFSVRDEHGGTLPLLTRTKNGAIATGVLVEAAQAAMTRARYGEETQEEIEPPGEPPEWVLAQLWTIANGAKANALMALERLTFASLTDSEEQRWRDTLTRDPRFPELALDLARNFLVMTVIPGEFEQRRVVKFDYEEQGQPAQGVFGARRKARRAERRQRRASERHRRAVSERLADGDVEALDVTVRTAGGDGVEGVVVSVLRPGEDHHIVDAASDPHGRVRFALEKGNYELQMRPPDGTVDLAFGERHSVTVPREKPKVLRCQPRRFSAGAEDGAKQIKLRHRIARAVSWRPREIRIAIPGVGHCTTFHVEVDAPDGMKITMARLTPQNARGRPDLDRQAQEFGPVQRTHLHVRGIAQSASATCQVYMRPRASLMVRMGFLSAMVTTFLLLAVAAWHSQLSGVIGSVASVLLFVPGGLAAYTARPRENSLTSSAVYGLRFLAVMIGAVSLLAASTFLLARTWVNAPSGNPPTGVTRTPTSIQPGVEWGGLEPMLWVLFAIAATITAVFAVTWFWTWRPPEQRPRLRQAITP